MRKKERFVLGKRTFRSQKSKHFVLRIINACQWGVMALDGKVVVEARYQKVEIEKDGTVHLTIIPGKVKTINL